MSLSPEDKQKLKDAFSTWAANAPKPNKPVGTFVGDGEKFSPRDIAKGVTAVVDGTDPDNIVGKHILDMVDNYVSNGHATLNEVIADFTSENAAPKKPAAGIGAKIKSGLRSILGR